MGGGISCSNQEPALGRLETWKWPYMIVKLIVTFDPQGLADTGDR